jgi:hypothetical protein
MSKTMTLKHMIDGKVYTRTTARAYTHVVVSRTNAKIAAAVEPLRADAMDRAGTYAHNMIERAYGELAANEWDLNKVAPNPHSYMSRRSYMTAKARRSFFQKITKALDNRWSSTGPYIVEANAECAKRFVDQAREDASFQFDAFVAKLSKKIGECDSAEIESRSVWQHSLLTVRKGEAVEVWQTQQIVNTSSLGKPFNQWPTRQLKLKGVAA